MTTTAGPATGTTPLPPLPHPVYFVLPARPRWRHVFDAAGRPNAAPPDPDQCPVEFWDNSDCWVMLTYLHLRRRGLDVRLAAAPVGGRINVLVTTDLGVRAYSPGCYFVLCRSDSARPVLCAHTVVQNAANVRSAADHYIPHWPQPGLIPRPPSRGDRVERLVFKGDAANLYEPFRSDGFRARLADQGVELRLDGKPDDRSRLRWHDYAEADAVLAVRDLTEADYLVKPASKLVNAWLAGTPALLGPEPAFRAVRQSDLDYIEVRSPDEALRAVARLRADPGLYRAMADNGRVRVREYTADAVAGRWRDVLAGPVAGGFERWRGRPGWVRAAVGPVERAVRTAAHLVAMRYYRHRRDHGLRPLSGRVT